MSVPNSKYSIPELAGLSQKEKERLWAFCVLKAIRSWQFLLVVLVAIMADLVVLLIVARTLGLFVNPENEDGYPLMAVLAMILGQALGAIPIALIIGMFLRRRIRWWITRTRGAEEHVTD
jgi:hypothetical protein